jgi:hypothetical protein
VEANAGTQQSPAGGEKPQQIGNKSGASTGAISKLRQRFLVTDQLSQHRIAQILPIYLVFLSTMKSIVIVHYRVGIHF